MSNTTTSATQSMAGRASALFVPSTVPGMQMHLDKVWAVMALVKLPFNRVGGGGHMTREGSIALQWSCRSHPTPHPLKMLAGEGRELGHRPFLPGATACP